MTDVIVEMPDGRIIGYYIDDGEHQVSLVTKKSSILTRKMRKVNLKRAIKILES